MKKVILLIVIILIGIAASPFLIGNPGYVLISAGNIAIESSIVAVGIFVILLFITLLFILKILKGGWRFSTGAWHGLKFAKKRKAQKQFNTAVSAYILGNNKQAEQQFIDSADYAEQQLAAYLLAADAAEKQHESANVEYYLKAIVETQESKHLPIEAALVAIQLHVKLKNYPQARELIDQYHQHIGHHHLLLLLEIDLSIIEQRFDNAIHYLEKARKEKQIDNAKITVWESMIYQGKFTQLFQSGGELKLTEYWQKLSKKLRQQETIVLAYCHVLAQFNMSTQLTNILLPHFKFSASTAFIQAIRKLPIRKADDLILATQKHLKKDPNNTTWLSCLGFLAYASNEHEMARKAYHRLLQQAEYVADHDDLVFYAKSLMALNEHSQANKILLDVNKVKQALHS